MCDRKGQKWPLTVHIWSFFCNGGHKLKPGNFCQPRGAGELPQRSGLCAASEGDLGDSSVLLRIVLPGHQGPEPAQRPDRDLFFNKNVKSVKYNVYIDVRENVFKEPVEHTYTLSPGQKQTYP